MTKDAPYSTVWKVVIDPVCELRPDIVALYNLIDALDILKADFQKNCIIKSYHPNAERFMKALEAYKNITYFT